MRREIPDLQLLALVTLAVPLTWLVFLGWDAQGLVLGGDSLREIPWLKRILETSADWQRLLYVPEIIGGTKLTPVLGIIPLYRLAALLHLAPIVAMNLAALTTQIAIGFLGIRVCETLASRWSRKRIHPDHLTRLGLLWLIAFAPVIAWRFNAGHLNLILGTAFFLCLLASVVSVLCDELTITLAAVITLTLCQSLLSNGHQTKLYSVVFGFPILLALAGGALRRPSRTALAICLVWVGSLLVVLPDFLGFVTHLRSGDGTRAIGRASVIYSYTTASLRDWLTSIPWARELFASGRSESLHHEINYAVGPVLLLAAVLLRRRRVLIGLVMTLIAVLIFASDIKPFSDWFPLLMPPLAGFRVPARAILPFCFALPILAVAQLLTRDRPSRPWQKDLGYAVAGVGLIVILPPALRELLVWCLAAYALADHFTLKPLPIKLPVAVVLVVLGAASVMAFRQRTVVEFPRAEAILDGLDEIAAQLRTEHPEIANPLNRLLVPIAIDPYWVNSGAAVGVSSLSGYFYPTWRYLKLLAGLSHIPYDPTLVLFNIQDGMPALVYLQPLYNIGGELQSDGTSFTIRPLPGTLGNSWFPHRSVWVDNTDALVAALTEPDSDLKQRLIETVWLVHDDPYFSKGFEPVDCEHGQVSNSRVLGDKAEWEFEVETSGTCTLVVATNYISNFIASAGGRELTVFPAYGALTGVIVPPGKSTVTLAVHDDRPAWSFWLIPVGIALLFWAAILCSRPSPRKQMASR